MTAPKTKPPVGLGKPGVDAWRRLTTKYEFEEHETLLLVALCGQVDDIHSLESVVRADGVVAEGSTGQQRISGAVSELRLARANLVKLFESLNLPADDGGKRATTRSRRSQKLAEKRWDAG